MSWLSDAEALILRGTGTWLTLGLALFLAAMGVVPIANGTAPMDAPGTWLPLAASASLAFMWVGTRTGSRLVQRLGIAIFLAWIAMLGLDLVGVA